MHLLVGGFNPFEKYARQIGSFPQVIRGENKNHHLDVGVCIYKSPMGIRHGIPV